MKPTDLKADLDAAEAKFRAYSERLTVHRPNRRMLDVRTRTGEVIPFELQLAYTTTVSVKLVQRGRRDHVLAESHGNPCVDCGLRDVLKTRIGNATFWDVFLPGV